MACSLPEGFITLINLTELYLNDTFLEYLPGSFGRLSKLKILEIRENRLKTLPKSLDNLVNLERLDIGTNEFEVFVSHHFSLFMVIIFLKLVRTQVYPVHSHSYKWSMDHAFLVWTNNYSILLKYEYAFQLRLKSIIETTKYESSKCFILFKYES